ncbi:MAG TPA: SRPBCC domain-containing protein [Granulicella sp.]
MQATETLIVDSRVFNAPRELVFQMFTDAEHIAHWWGPRGFTTKTERMDVAPGGLWIHTMISAEGVEYPNEVRYVEVEYPGRLVFDHLSDPLFRTTVTFTETAPDKTEVRYEMEFATSELRDSVVKTYGAMEGLHDTLSRFEELLATQGSEELVITREFDAPRELVYKCWTEPERLTEWWLGPGGSRLTIKHADIRPGGTMVYGMRMPDGKMVWLRWAFRDLTPPSRIVLVVSFVDEQENPLPHASAPALLERLSTVTFEEQGGKTLMTFRSQMMYAREEDRAASRTFFEGMQQGWTGLLNSLEAYLKTL